MAEAAVTKAFVCGHPIAHSRSPKIHGYWLKTYGIAGSYEAIDVAPQDAAGFFATMKERGFAGGNVTIPHKEAAFAAVARRDEAAEKIGAVNTLWFEDGVLCGGNTDAAGFAANLDERAPGWATTGPAVVLGAGGAARAVIQALKERGFADIRVTNRTVARAVELADRFGKGVTAHAAPTKELLGDAGLLVNTTALGMAGKAGCGRAAGGHEPAAGQRDRHRHRLCAAGDAAARRRPPARARRRSTGSACCSTRRCRASSAGSAGGLT